MTDKKEHVVIIGAGMVGSCIAHQLLEKYTNIEITILEKEKCIGKHTSGRNSGVLHAGLYYKPGTEKANVCVAGSRRLKKWIQERGLEINNCGKVIVPKTQEEDSQLDVLYKRGIDNGAIVRMIDEKELYKVAPDAVSCSGRAIWSPSTSVVNPKEVLQRLKLELEERNVRFIFEKEWEVDKYTKAIKINKELQLRYDRIFNTAGLNADKVARKLGLEHDYVLIPFKGIYWELSKRSSIKIRTNIYPVPNLELPFLGTHFTPISGDKVTIGPTATLAFGRENYEGIENLNLKDCIETSKMLTTQIILGKNNFRNYVKDQSPLFVKRLFFENARKLIPRLAMKDLVKSNKVGIRPQLYNTKTQNMEDDFICITDNSITHVLNAISPAFTASFELADKIISMSEACEKGVKGYE